MRVCCSGANPTYGEFESGVRPKASLVHWPPVHNECLTYRHYRFRYCCSSTSWVYLPALWGAGWRRCARSTRALDGGLTVLPALILGVLTAVGGGAIRDVLSGHTPKIFESGQFYAVAALAGSASFLAANGVGWSRTSSTTVGLIVGFSLRGLAMRYNLRTSAVRGDHFPHGF
jgi:hypothetical protein